jgi:hypothetical protein
LSFLHNFALQSTLNYSKISKIKIKKNTKIMVMNNKRLGIIISTATALLAIPFIAMQFTSEVDWKVGDFVLFGVLLFGTGLLCELILRNVKTTQNRIILCAVALLIFLLIWAELAVGIFGSPFAGS